MEKTILNFHFDYLHIPLSAKKMYVANYVQNTFWQPGNDSNWFSNNLKKKKPNGTRDPHPPHGKCLEIFTLV